VAGNKKDLGGQAVLRGRSRGKTRKRKGSTAGGEASKPYRKPGERMGGGGIRMNLISRLRKSKGVEVYANN